MLSIISCSKFCDERENEEIKLLLHKSIPEHGVIFEEVSESELKPGDIVLFLDDSSLGTMGFFKHVAVYCGEEEVIHFQYSKRSGGWISKEGFKVMKKKTGKCLIYRKKGGINLNDFSGKVKEAMNCEAKYSLGQNNCVHFALYLLGLVDFYMQLVEIKNQGSSKKTQRCFVI